METGTGLIHPSPVGSVLFGVTQEHLWFRPEQRPAERVMDSQIEKSAHRCSNCGIIVIETKK